MHLLSVHQDISSSVFLFLSSSLSIIYNISSSASRSPDRAPQILDMPSTIEWNLNSSPRIRCSASGNPLPSHTSIELRKLDSTVLKVSPLPRSH